MTLESLIAQYGLWGIGLGAGLEGETVAVLGGFTVCRGLLPYFPAVIAAFLGSFIADQIFFFLGRHLGNRAFVRKVKERPDFRLVVAAVERRPTLFVFGFRFLYGLRTISPIAIGMTNLPSQRFMVLNAVAALIWATVFVSIGYAFGQVFESVFGRIVALEKAIVPLIALGSVDKRLHP